MVKVFVNNERLDLYEDEQIQIISKSSDIENLNRVFSDFSQPFNVPATPTNNAIFKHYYNSNVDNGLNVNKRMDAYIEFHTVPFRFGKIQLEGVKMRDDYPVSYKLTFYSAITQLKERFGDDTISMLEYDLDGNKTYDTFSQYNFDWTRDNWYRTLWDDSFRNGDIFTPMVLVADRAIQLGTDDDRDIMSNKGPVRSDETRLALRLFRIIEGIERKYNITFSDHIFGSAQFKNLYMFLNRLEDMEHNGMPTYLNGVFTGHDSENRFNWDAPYMTCERNVYTDRAVINGVTTDTWYRLRFSYTIMPLPGYENVQYKLRVVDAYGRELNEQEEWHTGNSTIMVEYNSELSDPNVFHLTKTTEAVTLELITSDTIEYNLEANTRYTSRTLSGGAPPSSSTIVNRTNSTQNLETTQLYDVQKNVPDMSIMDFLSGLMKMFKAVILPKSNNDFIIKPIDDYYTSGNIYDITPYVEMRESSIDIPEIYNEIKFLYKKTDNFMGVQFRQMKDPVNDEVGYGDLTSRFDIDRIKELKVELPFELMLFERKYTTDGTPTNLIIGQSTTLDGDEFKKNKSGPFIFYRNGLMDIRETPIQISFLNTPDESGIYTDSDYITYLHSVSNINSMIPHQMSDTLCWGIEKDPLTNVEVNNSLYEKYWKNWLNNIYKERQRKLSTTAVLPLMEQMKLTLADKLIISDARYHINTMEMNLTNGKTKLVLFRDLFEEGQETPVFPTNIVADASGRFYSFKITTDGNWTVSVVDEGYGTNWVSLNETSGKGDKEIVVEVDTQLDIQNKETRRLSFRVKIGTIFYDVYLIQNGVDI